MSHTIEPATTGRSKCRGCAQPIPKGELRFGERIPNPFADEGETTLWFHLLCGAYKRPETLGMALTGTGEQIEERRALTEIIADGLRHHRLPRADGAERASSGRAKCRSCHAKISKDDWRVRVVFFQEGMFSPGGFIHLGCAEEYFGTGDLAERLVHFSSKLSDTDRVELSAALTH